MLVTCKHGGVTGHTGPDTAGIGRGLQAAPTAGPPTRPLGPHGCGIRT